MSAPLIAALLCAASLVLPRAHAQQGEADRKEQGELRAKAEKGDAQAQYAMGRAFSLGKLGAATNHVEAVKWWRQAAEQGHAPAQCNLGLAFFKGEGVHRDEAEALKAAEQGDPGSQLTLGVMFAQGNGVPTNTVNACMWFNLAAAGGIQGCSQPSGQVRETDDA